MAKARQRPRGRDKRKRKVTPKAGDFRPGSNGPNGTISRRGPDLVPRKSVVRAVMMAALFEPQLRTSTGQLSKSKWAKPTAGAGLHDLVRAYARALYLAAHGNLVQAAQASAVVTRLGEHFGLHLDGTEGGQRTRITIFNNPPAPAPGPAPEPYVEVSEREYPETEVVER